MRNKELEAQKQKILNKLVSEAGGDMVLSESMQKLNTYLSAYVDSEMQKFIVKHKVKVAEEKSTILQDEIEKVLERKNLETLAKNSNTKKQITCGHNNRKHYAKGMCSICYHKAGRTKLANKCEHTDRPNYARGSCQTCYLSLYYNEKRTKMTKKNNNK